MGFEWEQYSILSAYQYNCLQAWAQAVNQGVCLGVFTVQGSKFSPLLFQSACTMADHVNAVHGFNLKPYTPPGSHSSVGRLTLTEYICVYRMFYLVMLPWCTSPCAGL